MKRAKWVIFFVIVLMFNLYPQNKISVQLSGGIISPIDASKGLSGLLQLNYSTSENNIIYVNLSTSSWDRNRIYFNENNMQPIEAYNEINHGLNSIYFGDRITFNRNKYFDAFVDLELGYQHLSYETFDLQRYALPGGPISYSHIGGTERNESYNLLGTGIGVGIKHHMIGKFDLLLDFKLNTFINDFSSGKFYFHGTYLCYMLGFGYNIN